MRNYLVKNVLFFNRCKAKKIFECMPNCEILFTKHIPNLALKGSSEEMGFEPRLETFYRSTLTNSKRKIVPHPRITGI